MFRINDVYNNQGEKYRILSLLSEQIVWIEIEKVSALPELISFKDLTNLIEEDVCYLVDDPYHDLILQNPEDGSTAQLKRDSNYELIKPIVSHDLYYLPAERANPINEIIKSNKSTKQTVYRLLRRYWQRGQTPNTLLPSYKNSGAKGKKRTTQNTKLGRPRIYKEGSGAIINSEIERLFSITINRYLLNDKQHTILYAYRQFKTIYRSLNPDAKEPQFGISHIVTH